MWMTIGTVIGGLLGMYASYLIGQQVRPLTAWAVGAAAFVGLFTLAAGIVVGWLLDAGALPDEHDDEPGP